MKYLIALLMTVFVASPALAHSGHDHTAMAGGEWHHVVWAVVGVVVVAAAGFAWRQRSRNAD